MSRKQTMITFMKSLINRFRDDDVPALGAQLTYYLILSFFPFLIFLVSVLGFVQLSSGMLIHNFIQLLPTQTGDSIKGIVHEVTGNKSSTLLSFGMIATIWSASNGINAIIKGINKAYDDEEDRPFWKVRGIAVLATLVLAIVIILSLFMLIFGQVMGEYIFRLMHFPRGFDLIWSIAKYVIPLSVMTAVFTLLYWITPKRKLTLREVIPGAVFTTLGWIATSLLFSFYVNQFGSYTKTYGSLGGIIILLIWLYISSIIIVLGGEINAALAFNRNGAETQASNERTGHSQKSIRQTLGHSNHS